MVVDAEAYWLAGLLEGEGSFIVGPPSMPHCPQVALSMTDRDVVVPVARLFGRAMWRTVRNVDLGHKPAFVTIVRGASAAELMTALKPVMSGRRSTQIERALASAPRVGPRWKSSKRGTRPRFIPHRPRPIAGLEPEKPLLVPEAGSKPGNAWLVGLLEGEGCFGLTRGRYPFVSLNMCDADIVERAAAFFDRANVQRIHTERHRERGWSPSYRVAVVGSRVARLMRIVRPYMGLRRGTAIDRALAAYRPIRLTAPPPTCVVPGCDAHHESRGLCHKHYMMWSRDRASGRPQRITPLR